MLYTKMNTRETCNNKLQDDIISVKFYTIVETIKKFFSIFRENDWKLTSNRQTLIKLFFKNLSKLLLAQISSNIVIRLFWIFYDIFMYIIFLNFYTSCNFPLIILSKIIIIQISNKSYFPNLSSISIILYYHFIIIIPPTLFTFNRPYLIDKSLSHSLFPVFLTFPTLQSPPTLQSESTIAASHLTMTDPQITRHATTLEDLIFAKMSRLLPRPLSYAHT